VITFGDSLDLRIWHDPSTNFSYIRGYNNDLYIESDSADKDILFRADNGSGGTATYFVVDGSARQTRFYKDTRHADNIKANFGNGDDLKIWHDGTDSIIQNDTGDLEIQNRQNDGDIVFKSDDGSGGVAEYIRIDGGNTNVKFSKDLYLLDNVKARIGTGSDLQIYHNASNSIVENFVGDLILKNSANDKDIIFQSDDGSGSTVTYFLLDGSIGTGTGSVFTRFPDNSRVVFGTGSDLQIYHNATDSLIDNNTGHLYITNYADNKNIYFRTDDGSGGVAEYFRLDGSAGIVVASKEFRFGDNVPIKLGTGPDFQMLHNGATTSFENSTGNLLITNFADDSDIIFKCDDGSGGVTTYFFLDGSLKKTQFWQSTRHIDNVYATFGTSDDLQIYHNGSHSFINGSNGTGSLYIRPGSGGTIQLETNSGVDMISTNATDVRIYASGNERVRVKNIGINIQNVPTYADNTAAIAGGLTTGDVYRTGDLLKIVH
jgi:catechol 2,3-dioxygenase-like lactoylglutathione lyase family enzyme